MMKAIKREDERFIVLEATSEESEAIKGSLKAAVEALEEACTLVSYKEDEIVVEGESGRIVALFLDGGEIRIEEDLVKSLVVADWDYPLDPGTPFKRLLEERGYLQHFRDLLLQISLV